MRHLLSVTVLLLAGCGTREVVHASAKPPLTYAGTLITSGGSTDVLPVAGLTTMNHCVTQRSGESPYGNFSLDVTNGGVVLYFPVGQKNLSIDVFCDLN